MPIDIAQFVGERHISCVVVVVEHEDSIFSIVLASLLCGIIIFVIN